MREKKEKKKYEPPMVINLTAKDKAHAQCESGSFAPSLCSGGPIVYHCNTGDGGPPPE